MAAPRTVEEAVRRGQPRTVERLVREGAPVDGTEAVGWTPLMTAAVRNELKLTQLLLRLGADPNAVNQDGGGPLDLAARACSLPVLEALVAAGADVGRFGSAAVGVAIRKVRGEVALWLLERGAHGEWVNADGESLLDQAVAHDLPALIGPLLRAGANPDGQGPLRPLARAILLGRAGCIDPLLEAGAPLDPPEDGRGSPFLHALEWGLLALVQRMVERGARADGRAARRAAAGGQLEVLRWLAAQGADLRALDADGDNARTAAWGLGEDAVVAWLAAQGVPAQPEREAQAQARRAEVLQRRAEAAQRAAEAEAARQALLAGGARPGRVVDGPFATFTGLATVLPSGEIQAQVTIFGRSTPVQLRPEQWRFDP